MGSSVTSIPLRGMCRQIAFRRLGRSALENLLDEGGSKESKSDGEESDSDGDS